MMLPRGGASQFARLLRFEVSMFVALQVPWAHRQYLENNTMPWELEKQIRFHAAAVQFQLEQLYYGFALGVALNRTVILPEVKGIPACFIP